MKDAREVHGQALSKETIQTPNHQDQRRCNPLFARHGNLLRTPSGPDLDRETKEDENRGGIVETSG